MSVFFKNQKHYPFLIIVPGGFLTSRMSVLMNCRILKRAAEVVYISSWQRANYGPLWQDPHLTPPPTGKMLQAVMW